MNKDSTYVLFPGLEEKEKYLIDVIKNYDIDSIIKAAFTINSWRNNRGAQESCLSLNAAILHCDGYGKKRIDLRLSKHFVPFQISSMFLLMNCWGLSSEASSLPRV